MAQSVKPADAGVSVGQVLMGKYRVDAILGQGGMGVVAACTHLALNERVAIKLLRQDVLLDQDAVSRFMREAQAAVKLKSEYVARVSDVGSFDDGVPYMVMEYLEGDDLGVLLEQRSVLPVQWAVELILQTAEALCEAHSLGIVHRDVKPSNLFVTWRTDGTSLIKVLDFGISKSPMGADMQLTQTQSLLGTPAYMSPEQMRSARLVDHRTDIWSLGTVFYEILEGRKPFQADSFSEMCVKVAVDDPDAMKNAPPPLQQVIARCLAKAPDQRYPNMAELARDLIPFSADPHGAQTLVERMVRMLKRSSYDWEVSSTSFRRLPSSIPGTPIPSRPSSQPNLGSAPTERPWHSGSDPAMQAWHANTPIPRLHTSPLTLDEPEAAHAGPTLNEGTRRSRVPWLVAILVLAVAGGAAAYVIGSQDIDSIGQQRAADDTPQARTPATGSASASGVATPSPDASAAPTGSATLPPPPAPSDVAATDRAALNAPAIQTGGEPPPTSGKPKPGNKTHVRSTKGKTPKNEPKSTKLGADKPPVETKPPVQEKKPACDPFTSRTGCK